MTTATQCKPIIFSGQKPRWILDDLATMTRRVVKPIHGGVIGGPAAEPGHAVEAYGGGAWHIPSRQVCIPCPYGAIGDKLWVRETWQPFFVPGNLHTRKQVGILYCADGNRKQDERAGLLYSMARAGKQRSSIHLPRWASRITLTITDLRMERVQEVAEQDAVAEGFERREHFIRYWDSLNAKRGFSFDANPWVWVISFKRDEQ